jgi:hypothetical protein
LFLLDTVVGSGATNVPAMAPNGRQDSAPDLRILGDSVTLQPSGYVEPALTGEDGQEEALMKNMARFRSEPLRCVACPFTVLTLALLD